MCLAIPGRIVRIDAADPELRVAEVDFGGTVRTVQLLYTPDAVVGSFVIVHAGFATDVIPEADALEAIAYARELDATGAIDDPAPGHPEAAG